MEQYLPKSALIAEIERRIAFFSDINNKQVIDSNLDCAVAFAGLRDFLDTLETKEVNFEKEFDNYANGILACDVQFEPFTHLHKCAKHFYELGLKAQSKDMIEAIRTEYEKGRADVIADTLSWLENVWPQYCSNPNIIEGFKEAIKGE